MVMVRISKCKSIQSTAGSQHTAIMKTTDESPVGVQQSSSLGFSPCTGHTTYSEVQQFFE